MSSQNRGDSDSEGEESQNSRFLLGGWEGGRGGEERKGGGEGLVGLRGEGEGVEGGRGVVCMCVGLFLFFFLFFLSIIYLFILFSTFFCSFR